MLSQAVFTTSEMDNVFSSSSQIAAMLAFESALAKAQAAVNKRKNPTSDIPNPTYTERVSDVGFGMSDVGTAPKSQIPNPTYTEGVSDFGFGMSDVGTAPKSQIPNPTYTEGVSDVGFGIWDVGTAPKSQIPNPKYTEGVIPLAAAAVIQAVCKSAGLFNTIDVENVEKQTLLAGNPAIPFVKLLIEKVKQRDAEAAKYVHFGATSQDVLDTAMMLQLKTALIFCIEDLEELERKLSLLALFHRETLMIGRTLLQQARPITFGYKVATWLDGVSRSRARIVQITKENLTLQLGGAVGTLSTLGSAALRVKAAMAKELALNDPAITWHGQRDRFAEIVTMLGILNGSLGKIAKDVTLLMQTEIGEVFEGAAEGKGGSSAMPHKRNPVSSVFMVAIATRTPALVATFLSAMVQEHERAAGNWHAEWHVITDLVKLTAANLKHANDLIGHLEVDKDRMLQNLELTQGLIFAEDITAALSPKMGKAAAHQFVEQACKAALKEKIHLKAYLLENTDILTQITEGVSDVGLGISDFGKAAKLLDSLFDAKNAIGVCDEFVGNFISNLALKKIEFDIKRGN